ncbi:MAG TPA: hypothetical protein GX399_04510 [Xanthomonadaceae bacterium]|nr:hypothetical protein [Xanthomonadaceae bacterium]
MINTMILGLAAPLRGEGLFPCHDIGPRQRAPRLALVADIQGNELNGMFVLSRLATFLRSIGAGERRGLRLRERVVLIPTTNTLDARDAGARRLAVARARAETGCRRATEDTVIEAVMAMTRAAYYRVDIHPTSFDVEEMPQVRLYAPNDDERATACLFGLPAVIERPIEGAEPSLVRAWRRRGGENFVIHAGQAGSLQTRHCETLFRALVAFLDRTGIVGGLNPTEEEEELRYFGLRQVFVVMAQQSGIFSSRLDVGRWIRVGEELGQIYDSFSGGVRARVVAPVAGLLASLRRQPLLYKGDLVARILIPDNAAGREPMVAWGAT